MILLKQVLFWILALLNGSTIILIAREKNRGFFFKKNYDNIKWSITKGLMEIQEI